MSIQSIYNCYGAPQYLALWSGVDEGFRGDYSYYLQSGLSYFDRQEARCYFMRILIAVMCATPAGSGGADF